MTKEQQKLAWACLPKDERDEIISVYACKNDSNSSYNEGYRDALRHLFGHHNLTSDTEPSELLFVERKKVQGVFAMHERAENKVAVRAIQALFGDKCLPDKEETCNGTACKYYNSSVVLNGCTLSSCKFEPKFPDKEPSVQGEPRFNVGDMALVIDGFAKGGVITITAVNDAPPISYKSDIRDNGIAQWFVEEMLAPYTEP